jgi:signal peptidase I
MQKTFVYLILSVLIALTMRFWALEGFTIPTASMQPTLMIGDKLWINKLPFISVKKGDIIAFDFPLDRREKYVKRCAAMAGDTIYKINGLYLLSPTDSRGFVIPKKGQTIELNADNFAFYQPIIQRYENVQAAIIGNEMYVNNSINHSYTFKQNYLYGLGDNPSESYDSRNWGLIPEDYLIGKALFIWK